MNEHDNLTPSEMESYRSALKEAYPAPKTDIHANVMKQIRAERLAEKQRKRRAAFVKWGSVAACLLLVCMIAIRVVPDMDKLAAPEAANMADAMAEDASVARYDVRDNDGIPYEEVSEEEYSYYTDENQYGATTPSYDPKYGDYELNFPTDDKTEAEMQGGKTPAGVNTESVSDSTKQNKFGITLTAENVTSKGLTLVCNQSGGEDIAELTTGSYYVIEKLEGEDWVKVPYAPQEYDVVWDMVAYFVKLGGETTYEINWEWLYGTLGAGEYRIGKEITNFRATGDYDSEILCAEFIIK
jgi:hypothetical protein